MKLKKLDCLSLIVAAVCHDLGHDGFNNSYHVNAVTRRAIDSNDGAVQEAYHAAELFRIISQDRWNFTEKFSKDEFLVFRKRVTGLILSTDMARHVSDLSTLNALINDNAIKDGQNLDKLIEGVEDKEKFKS